MMSRHYNYTRTHVIENAACYIRNINGKTSASYISDIDRTRIHAQIKKDDILNDTENTYYPNTSIMCIIRFKEWKNAEYT